MSDWNTPLTLTAITAGSTVQLTKVGSPTVSGLQYRTDSSAAWSSYTIDDVITLASVGDYVQFQNTESTLSSGSSSYVQFILSGSLGGSGNVQSLLNYSDSCKGYCYFRLFFQATSLISSPDLLSVILASSCYNSMFYGSGITKAPDLPATTLINSCYAYMFQNCSSLTSALLGATELSANSCLNMFVNCVSLSSIGVSFTFWLTGATTNWLSGVASSGNFYKPNALPETRGVSNIPTGWTIKSEYKPLTFTAKEANSTVKITKTGSPAVGGLRYRTSTSSDWTSYTIDDVITLSNVDDYVQFENTEGNLSTSDSNYASFALSGKVEATGNIQALLSYSTSCNDFCYWFLFYNNPALLTAPEFPALVLGRYCYGRALSLCTALKVAPALPAMLMQDYCYTGMFRGCTGLIKAPDLPATTLAQYCYINMFNGCTSLVEAPYLPATTASYRCYYEMFHNCSALQYISLSLNSWPSADTMTDWVAGVSSTGTFYKKLKLPEEYGVTRIPQGWDVINVDEIECSPGLPTLMDPLGVTVKEEVPLTLTATQDNSTVKLTATGSPTTAGLHYRLGTSGKWLPYTIDSTINLNSGDSVQCWNSAETLSAGTTSYVRIIITGSIRASGNIQSLLNYITSVPDFSFYDLFSDQSGLLAAPDCPATTLGYLSCYEMFWRCPQITEVRIEAETLGSYSLGRVFRFCSALARIEVNFSSWDAYLSTTDWVDGVAASGVFIKPSTLPEEYGTGRIPEGWTVINKD